MEWSRRAEELPELDVERHAVIDSQARNVVMRGAFPP